MTELSEVKADALVPSFHAVAVNATEMQEAQEQIKSFVDTKIASLSQEESEVGGSLEVAKKNKWATKTLASQLRKIVSRKMYYSKLRDALNAGYTIIPNMDLSIFAIRTKRTHWPKWNGKTGTSKGGYSVAAPYVPNEKEMVLPTGAGEYRSDQQMFHELRDRPKNEKGEELYRVQQVCDGYADIDFPFAAAYPIVMDATSAAMAHKIFDRIGIVPQTRSKAYRGDPIIVGQIVRKEGYSEKVVSFLIAWHLDVRTL